MSQAVKWLSPSACAPPHRVARPEQVEGLAREFRARGWDPGAPTLVGYELDGAVQLLSGSHRWAAAELAGLALIPVVVRGLRRVQVSWGDLIAWAEVMRAPVAGPSPAPRSG